MVVRRDGMPQCLLEKLVHSDGMSQGQVGRYDLEVVEHCGDKRLRQKADGYLGVEARHVVKLVCQLRLHLVEEIVDTVVVPSR